jgi:hypothetical protein
MSFEAKFHPPLDPEFVSPALWNRAYRAAVRDSRLTVPPQRYRQVLDKLIKLDRKN